MKISIIIAITLLICTIINVKKRYIENIDLSNTYGDYGKQIYSKRYELEQTGKDRPGGDLTSKGIENHTLDDCSLRCDSYKTCFGFSWNKDTFTCYPKSAYSGNLETSTDLEFYKRKANVDGDPFQYIIANIGYDAKGTDIMDNGKGLTLETCAEKCSTTDGCQGISFDNKDGACYTKKDIGGPTKNGSFVFYKKVRAPQYKAEEPHHDRNVDTHIKYLKNIDNEEDCIEACNANQDCNGYSISNKQCYLKSRSAVLKANLKPGTGWEYKMQY